MMPPEEHIPARDQKHLALTKEKFDERSRNLLTDAMEYARQMLEQAKGKGYDKRDRFLLVSGPARMPQIIERIRRELDIERLTVEPHAILAKVAALFGQGRTAAEQAKVTVDGARQASRRDRSVRLARRTETFWLST